MRRWLLEVGRDPAPLLARADLGWVPAGAPLLPIPLRGAIRLLVEIARVEGPDAPLRIVGQRGGFEIGRIGAEAFCGPTVGAGLHRVARAMPLHCTHEVFTVTDIAGAVHVRDGWAMTLGGAEERHLVQQYVAALVDMICSVAAGASPSAARVAMVPHPEAGLSHLVPFLGERVHASEGATLDVEIPRTVARLPVPENVQTAALRRAAMVWPPLRNGETLSNDVATLVETMLPWTRPSIGRVAAAAGTSGRTLRRRLLEEGRTFTKLVEETRARIALARLEGDPRRALRDVAAELGYSSQATLTRAVQRWTGKRPREMRKSERRNACRQT